MGTIFRNALSHIERVLQAKYDVSSTIRHKGERGRQREDGLRLFLRESLPAKYGVATGEVIPSSGKTASPQCDIIVYDRLEVPVLGSSAAVQQVPLEGVYAVIEVKSLLDTIALRDAAIKFESIRKMKQSRPRKGHRRDTERGPIFILFGYKLRTTPAKCKQFIVDNSRNMDCTLVALDSGCSIWITDPGRSFPIWVPITPRTRPKDSAYPTLSFFFAGLLDDMKSIELGKPRFLDIVLGG